MDLKFISPAADDADKVYYYLANSFKYYNPDMTNYESEFTQIYRRVKDNFDSYNLVKYDGEKAAYYYFHEYGDFMMLEDIHVLSRFRNHGIGSTIIRRCLSATERPICAELYYHNVYARSLFRHNGFVITEQIDARRCMVVNKNNDVPLCSPQKITTLSDC